MLLSGFGEQVRIVACSSQKALGAQERKVVGYERIICYVLRLGSIRSVGLLNDYLLFCVVQFYFVEFTISACVWR